MLNLNGLKKNNAVIIFLFLTTVVNLVGIGHVSALMPIDPNQPGVPVDSFNSGTTGLPGEDLDIEGVFNIIVGLACWLTRIAGGLMIIFLVIAGLRFMHAKGDPSGYQAAVKNFWRVFTGILVIMGVYVIIATVANAVGASPLRFSFIPFMCYQNFFERIFGIIF